MLLSDIASISFILPHGLSGTRSVDKSTAGNNSHLVENWEQFWQSELFLFATADIKALQQIPVGAASYLRGLNKGKILRNY